MNSHLNIVTYFFMRVIYNEKWPASNARAKPEVIEASIIVFSGLRNLSNTPVMIKPMSSSYREK